MARPQWFEDWLEKEFDPIRDRFVEWHGAWKLILGVGTVAGIVGVFFGVLAYFSEHH